MSLLEKLSAVLIFFITACTGALAIASDWPVYGGDAGGRHYSTLDTINRENVADLEAAWSFRHGELEGFKGPRMTAGWHVTPILLPEEAGQSLVICTPFNRVIALNPTTGEQRWAFDPEVGESPEWSRHNCRGVAYWQDMQASASAVCKHRVYAGTETMELFAVDALTGELCGDFGVAGRINVDAMTRLKTPDLKRGDMQFASPPVVIGDTVIVGSSDNTKTDRSNNPSGAVRAFNTRSGELRWSFDPVPRNQDDPAADGWTADALARTGGANVWSMMSVDEALGLVYLPTASAGPQFYGGNRPGDNRYANSIVAVSGETGKVVWHYQLLHHDVWDMDIPAQPILLDLELNGKIVPAVVQLTKQGLTFIFNRATGAPLFPIEERPVPQGGVSGELLSPTQPFPTQPAPLGQLGINPEDAWGFTIFDESGCREAIATRRHGDIYIPPSPEGTVMLPGLAVTNWGGAAWDPEAQNLIVPVNKAPLLLRLVAAKDLTEEELNDPMAGKPFGPPGLIKGTDYAVSTGPLLSAFMTPCIKPPWGELLSLNLASGKVNWRRTMGVIDGLSPMPLPLEWGTPMSGGPIVTAGGLIFLGATADERFRALDVATGKTLWETRTPTSSMATPMTYQIDGRQYVVIASGGHMWLYGRGVDDYLVAYALPENKFIEKQVDQ